MTVLGTAEVIVHPNTSGFHRELEAGTTPAFGSLTKDAEKHGEQAGAKLGEGFGRGSGKIRSALDSLGVPLGTLGGHLSKTAEGLGSVDRSAQGLHGTMHNLGAGALVGVAGGFVAVGAASVDASLKQQTATASLAASAGISVAAAGRIGNAFTDTMGKAIYSGTQITTAYAGVAGELGSVEGHALDARDASTVMAASMNLAEGAGIQLGNATQDTANVMQAYHLQVTQAASATDILFSTSRVTGISVDTLTATLDRMKAKLGDLAPSLGDSAGLLNALAKNGISGRTAMSALNGGFNTLLGGGKKVQDMAKYLGLQIFDSTGKFVGMHSIISQLEPKLAGLTQQSQLEATKALFGASANKQLLDVILQGPAAYQRETDQVTKSGAAKAAAEKQSQTFAHQVDVLKATAVDLAIKFGNVLIPVLATLMGALGSSITFLDHHKAAMVAVAAVVTGVLGTAIAIFVTDKIAAFTAGVDRMIGRFTLLRSASTTTASQVNTDAVKSQTAVQTEAASIERSTVAIDNSFASTATSANTAAGGISTAETDAGGYVQTFSTKTVAANDAAATSFAGVAGAAETAAGGIAAETAAMAGTVEAADASIEAANVAAGASFTAMLGPIAAVVAAVAAAQPLINSLTGGGLSSGPGDVLPAGQQGPGQLGLHVTHKGGSGSRYGNYYSLPTGSGDYGNVGKTTFDFLREAGFNPAVAAGFVGNFQQESSLNSSASGGYLAQWGGSRLTGLQDFAKQIGLPVTALTTQLNYVLKELGENPSMKKAIAGAKTPQQAADLISKLYERPGVPMIANREQYAASAYQQYGGTSAHGHATLPLQLSGTGTLPASLTGGATKHTRSRGAAAAGQYVSPFLDPAGLHLGRTDQGVDVSGLHAGARLGAIGQGVIDQIIPNWYKGQPLVEETLTAGSKKGQHVYYAEQLTPGVHTGQHVKAGQTIGRVAASGTGLELGFGAGGGRTLAQATTGYKEGQITPAGTEFRSFLGSLGKGGTALGIAVTEFTAAQKAAALAQREEAKKQTADAKAGNTMLTHIVSDIHKGGVAALEADVDKTHTAALSNMVKTLHNDHSSKLDTLAKQLVQAHKDALTALHKALVQAWIQGWIDQTKKQDQVATDQANNQAKAIANQSKITLDQAAETGKTGADLAAAQAQTHLDQVTAFNDALIGNAQVAVDQAANGTALQQEQAQHALTAVQNAATVSDAQAQATLDQANAAAQAAQAASQAAQAAANTSQQTATATNTVVDNSLTATAGSPAAAAAPNFNLTIYGEGMNANELMNEIAWSVRTGALPIAAPAAPGGA